MLSSGHVVANGDTGQLFGLSVHMAGHSGEEEFLGLRFACIHHKAGDMGVSQD
jgi:hypothetical protein